jgi:hypothetical protein
MPSKSSSRKSSQSSQGKIDKPNSGASPEVAAAAEPDQVDEVQQFIQDQLQLPASQAVIWESGCLDLVKGEGLAEEDWTLSQENLNEEKIRVAAMQSFCKESDLSDEEVNNFRDLYKMAFAEIKSHGNGMCTLNDFVQYVCTRLVKDERQNAKYINEDVIAKLEDRLKALNKGNFSQKIDAVAASLTESRFGPPELQIILALAYEIVGNAPLVNLANMCVATLAGLVQYGSSNAPLQCFDPRMPGSRNLHSLIVSRFETGGAAE